MYGIAFVFRLHTSFSLPFIVQDQSVQGHQPTVESVNPNPPVNPWADAVKGMSEHHRPCPQCLMGPCITVSPITKLEGSCAPDVTNHSRRHKDYRRFWKTLKDRGLWQDDIYIQRKTATGLSEHELRELMPECVLYDTIKRYPNPPGIPCMGHRWS